MLIAYQDRLKSVINKIVHWPKVRFVVSIYLKEVLSAFWLKS